MSLARIADPVAIETGPQTLRLTVTLGDGRTLAEWTNFKISIREDPVWSTTAGPRQGAALVLPFDPETDGWEEVQTVTSTTTEAPNILVFTLPGGLSPGVRRYSVDAWGVIAGSKDAHMLAASWATVATTNQ